MISIEVDFNAIHVDGTLRLDSAPLIEELAALGDRLISGDDVLLTQDDIRATATLYRLESGIWEARSEWRFEHIEPP